MKPYLIAIAGCSGAGKSTLARYLKSRLPATIFDLDAYYYSLDHLAFEERAAQNFDHPDALDVAELTRNLRALAAGEAIERPIYDFTVHTRLRETQRVQPNEYIIVEGLFPLHWPQLRELFQTKVFVDAEHKTCLPRRQARDVAERGRTAESVQQQYERTVKPMAEQFIVPTKAYADVVVDGSLPVEHTAEAVLEHVARTRSAPKL